VERKGSDGKKRDISFFERDDQSLEERKGGQVGERNRSSITKRNVFAGGASTSNKKKFLTRPKTQDPARKGRRKEVGNGKKKKKKEFGKRGRYSFKGVG